MIKELEGEVGEVTGRRKLGSDEIALKLSGDGRQVLASLYERGGYREWEQYRLADLPNDLISLDDLKRFGINKVDMQAAGGLHEL